MLARWAVPVALRCFPTFSSISIHPRTAVRFTHRVQFSATSAMGEEAETKTKGGQTWPLRKATPSQSVGPHAVRRQNYVPP